MKVNYGNLLHLGECPTAFLIPMCALSVLVALKSLWFAGWCWELAGLEADNWYLWALCAKLCVDGRCPWLCETQCAYPAVKAQVGGHSMGASSGCLS